MEMSENGVGIALVSIPPHLKKTIVDLDMLASSVIGRRGVEAGYIILAT
jgi:anti-anti-sigma regulatory factor